MDSPPAALEAQSTLSRFFFSLSAERPESEKQQPCGQNSTVSVKDAHSSSNGINIPPQSGCGFSFAALSAANEKINPQRSLRLCGEYKI
jgi:hypothetical protein